jgi:uncharacterized protein YegL
MVMPNVEFASRPLNFFWIVDQSGSMNGNGKIQALNRAIREALPHMQQAARENPNARILVRVLTFGDGAQWHVSQATPVEEFNWLDIAAVPRAATPMGQAMLALAQQMKVPPMQQRALPPVCVLVSDGQPTDDFNAGLRAFMAEEWGKRSVRLAIAIGGDADLEPLRDFIGNDELEPLKADNPEALVAQIRWASVEVLKAVSQPRIENGTNAEVAPVVVPSSIASPSDKSVIW